MPIIIRAIKLLSVHDITYWYQVVLHFEIICHTRRRSDGPGVTVIQVVRDFDRGGVRRGAPGGILEIILLYFSYLKIFPTHD